MAVALRCEGSAALELSLPPQDGEEYPLARSMTVRNIGLTPCGEELRNVSCGLTACGSSLELTVGASTPSPRFPTSDGKLGAEVGTEL